MRKPAATTEQVVNALERLMHGHLLLHSPRQGEVSIATNRMPGLAHAAIDTSVPACSMSSEGVSPPIVMRQRVGTHTLYPGERHREVTFGRGSVFMPPRDRPGSARGENTCLDLFAVEPGEWFRVVGAVYPDLTDLRYQPPRALEPVAARHWLAAAHAVITAPGVPTPANRRLVWEQAFRTLVVATVELFGLRDCEPERRDRRSLHLVQVAEAYIHDHAMTPLTVADLARVCGCSVRNLQYAFRAERGCSPMQSVRSVRLQLARQDLLGGDPARTTAEIGLRWGFGRPARFRAAYRAQFGVDPDKLCTDG